MLQLLDSFKYVRIRANFMTEELRKIEAAVRRFYYIIPGIDFNIESLLSQANHLRNFLLRLDIESQNVKAVHQIRGMLNKAIPRSVNTNDH